MIIQTLLKEIETSKNPVAKALHKNQHFKVIAIAFKKNMILKEHKTHLPTKLFVISGNIIYHENEISTALNLYDEIEIPMNILHSVEAVEDSFCLLTQG